MITTKNDMQSEKEMTPWFHPVPLQRPGKTLQEAFVNSRSIPRFRYAFKPPFIFDCRCHGGVQIKIDAIYKQFLSLINKAVDEKTPLMDCAADFNYQIDPAILRYGDIILNFSENCKDDIKKAALKRFEKLLATARENIASRYCILHDTWEDTEFERRMGIGDIIVMIGMLQKIEAVVGFDNMLVIYDPEYPCYNELMTASGLNVLQAGKFDSLDSVNLSRTLPCLMKKRGGDTKAITFISFRNHFLGNRQGDTSVCLFGEKEGFPGAQMLYDLGWEQRVSWHPFKVSLVIPAYNQKRADALIRGYKRKAGGIITATPLELTRGNRAATAGVWADVFHRHNRQNSLVLIGCTPEQATKARKFMDEVQDIYLRGNHRRINGGNNRGNHRRIRYTVVTEDLMTWAGIINRADHHFTGNNCGLWLGMTTQTPMTIVSFQTDEHGTQWEPKANWFSKADQKRIRIVNQIEKKNNQAGAVRIGSF